MDYRQQIAYEVMRRSGARQVLRDGHPGQQRLYSALREGARRVGVISPRRWGKSEAFLRYAIGCGWTRALFIDDLPSNAYDTVLPIAEGVAASYGLDLIPNGQRYRLRIGQLQLHCVGWAHESIEKCRGKWYDGVIWDELQKAALSDVTRTIRSILDRCLDDRDGPLVATWTPGDLDVGLAYEITRMYAGVTDAHEIDLGESRKQADLRMAGRFTLIKGEPFENPYTSQQQRRRYEEDLAADPEHEHDPAVRREIYAEWVADRADLVLPLEESHLLTEWRPQAGDRYICAIDYGWHPDPTAIVIGVTNPTAHDRIIWLAAEEGTEWSDELIAQKVEGYRARLDGEGRHFRVVYDFGGGGTRHVGVPLREYSVPSEPCSKTEDERLTMRKLRVLARRGRLQLYHLDDPSNPKRHPLYMYYARTKWVATSAGLKVGKPRHMNDCVRYMMTKADHDRYRPAPPAPTNKQRMIAQRKQRQRPHWRHDL